ncbi:hypothetical protein [Stenotrophomonas maltophilia]|uniref:hypothetical protein n=1 Tax=Stenotrophomonas maltophilia TaxID=40324 RepID=UPI002552E917|nr:hypothetical protein [Stenotrophomonas maltophilia]
MTTDNKTLADECNCPNGRAEHMPTCASLRATLADVQPGGRVRLGHQAQVTISDDLLSSMAYAIPGAVETTDKAKAVAARVVEVYLSAQPSPGGQGAPERCSECRHATFEAHPDGHICVHCKLIVAARQPVECETAAEVKAKLTPREWSILMAAVGDARAARQPVVEPAYNSDGISLTACQLHEALLMAGDPELDVPFEDRSLVRIFWTETGHSGPGLYCECVDAEEEGCILLDGTAPAIGQSAQAVDLDQFRPLASYVIEQAAGTRGDMHMLACQLLALIDRKADGND